MWAHWGTVHFLNTGVRQGSRGLGQAASCIWGPASFIRLFMPRVRAGDATVFFHLGEGFFLSMPLQPNIGPSRLLLPAVLYVSSALAIGAAIQVLTCKLATHSNWWFYLLVTWCLAVLFLFIPMRDLSQRIGAVGVCYSHHLSPIIFVIIWTSWPFLFFSLLYCDFERWCFLYILQTFDMIH